MRATAALFAVLSAVAAQATGALTIGTKAPALSYETLVKGKKVDLSKGVHVVEFWATWCPPCKTSIPHLTALAKKYAGKATFTGVSVWERVADPLPLVKSFVESYGDKMAYNVAWDGAGKTMTASWMEAAGQDGIPAAFVVKDGVVQWIGHPMMGLDETVAKVIAGTFDLAAAKAASEKEAVEAGEMQRKQAETRALLAPTMDLVTKGDIDGALKDLDALAEKRPDMVPTIDNVRFSVLLGTDDARMNGAAMKLADGVLQKSAEGLNSLAWAMVDPEGKRTKADPKVAVVIGERAAKLSEMKNAAILDTYALALHKAGRTPDAIKVQREAIAILKANKADAAEIKEYEERLRSFGTSH